MILSKHEIEPRTNEILDNLHNFLILDVKHIKYGSIDNFNQAIELLNFCKITNDFNKIYLEMKIEKEFNLDIIYKALQAVLSNKNFNDKDLIEYFTLHRDITKLVFSTEVFSHLSEHLNFNKVDLHLLGFSLKEEKDIRFNHTHTYLFDNYSDLFDNMWEERIDIPTFINSAKKLIETARKNEFLETA